MDFLNDKIDAFWFYWERVQVAARVLRHGPYVTPPKPIDMSWVWKEGPMTPGQMKQIAYDDIGFCGCGSPNSVAEYLARVIADPNISDPTDSEEFVLYILDHAGLLEHGSNVCRSWPTAKGKAWMDAVREHGDDPWLKGTVDYATGEMVE